jgi:flavorubredoxin
MHTPDPRSFDCDSLEAGDHPIEFAPGIFWVGFREKKRPFNCNPYLIIEGDEAVLIDGGSRPDFPTVMMRILQTGIRSAISALIYQHYDPDLCGSIAHFKALIARPGLQVISDVENEAYIQQYAEGISVVTLDQIEHRFRFQSGRELVFIPTPYAHSLGSFMTFDATSGVLFCSDLFGSYARNKFLFFKAPADCPDCPTPICCHRDQLECPYQAVVEFQARTMPSVKSLRLALSRAQEVPFKILAPQHGQIIAHPIHARHLIELLNAQTLVGIDALVPDPKAGPA